MKGHNGRRQFPGFGSQPQPTVNTPVSMQHGHDGSKVVVIFNQPLRNLMLSEEEARTHITALEGSLAELRKHKAARDGQPDVPT